MATGKRASMREGPLADLFRRTTDDNPPRHQEPEPPAARQPAPPPAREPELPAAAPPEPSAARSPQAASPASESIQRRRAHPSLEADAQSPEFDEPAREIPSPQERLRQAFSADIPQNVMERPGAAEPAGDVY